MAPGRVFGGPRLRARISAGCGRIGLASISPSNLGVSAGCGRRGGGAAVTRGRPASRKPRHVGRKCARGLGFGRIVFAQKVGERARIAGLGKAARRTMALGAIGAEQLRRRLARSEVLRRRRRACKCRRESKNENRDLLHVPATPGFPEQPLLTHSGGGARLFFRSRVSVAPV